MAAVELVQELLDLCHVVADDLQGDSPVQIPVVLPLQLGHLRQQPGQPLLQSQQKTLELQRLFKQISVCSSSAAAVH